MARIISEDREPQPGVSNRVLSPLRSEPSRGIYYDDYDDDNGVGSTSMEPLFNNSSCLSHITPVIRIDDNDNITCPIKVSSDNLPGSETNPIIINDDDSNENPSEEVSLDNSLPPQEQRLFAHNFSHDEAEGPVSSIYMRNDSVETEDPGEPRYFNRVSPDDDWSNRPWRRKPGPQTADLVYALHDLHHVHPTQFIQEMKDDFQKLAETTRDPRYSHLLCNFRRPYQDTPANDSDTPKPVHSDEWKPTRKHPRFSSDSDESADEGKNNSVDRKKRRTAYWAC
ncbi:hypothetical protein AAE478_004139 [Parahypoxylon ruwenzoriense]